VSWPAPPEWLELRFVERAPRFEHVARATDPTTLAEDELTTGDVLPFSLTLPGDALPSVHTDLGSLLWELRVKVDVPLRPDFEERLELVVDGSSAT
jgi:hypothetical protein